MIEMAHFTATVLAATSTKKSSSSSFFLILLVIGAAGYFLFLRPQQKKARAARAQGSAWEIGDDVQTIGGIIGTVIDIEGDKVTIVSGADDSDHGAQPTRLVLVRGAIAKKVVPPVPVDEYDADEDHDESDHDDHDHDHDDSDDGTVRGEADGSEGDAKR